MENIVQDAAAKRGKKESPPTWFSNVSHYSTQAVPKSSTEMKDIFEEAAARRRSKEFTLTSTNTNAIYYGSPVYARKKAIWPPISRESGAINTQKGVDKLPRHNRPRCTPPAPKKDHAQSSQAPDEHLSQLTLKKDVLYHPLHDGDTIRILEIHPGLEGDPIVCEFHYANLQRLHMDYEALSYVWGEKRGRVWIDDSRRWEDKIHTVLCNGDERETTPNLHQALCHIRNPSKPTFLWADALCINQDDDQERGHQVTLMGAVYRNAKRVLIWLGEGNKRMYMDEASGKILEPPAEFENVRAQRSFGAICEIVNRWQGTDSETQSVSYRVSDPSTTNEFGTFEDHPSAARDYDNQDLMHKVKGNHYLKRFKRDDFDSDRDKPQDPDRGIDSPITTAPDSQFWMSIADLFERSWFWRVWVVQEAILAKAAVVKWANVEIDWQWIGLAAAILRTSHHGICEEMQIGGVYNAYLMFRLSPMSDLPPPELSFIELLRLTRQFEVTDSRDRVYGLLGMKTVGNDPEGNQLFIVPDYTMSEAEVWKQVAWKEIRRSGNLAILSSVQYTTGQYDCKLNSRVRDYFLQNWRVARVEIASWVPRWDIVYRATLAAWDSNEGFHAAKGFPLELIGQTDKAPEILTVRGIQAGTVGYEGTYMWHDVDTSLLVLAHLGPFFASESGLRVLCRTYTAGRNAYGSLTDSTDEPLFDFAAYVLSLHKRANARGDSDNDDFNFRGMLSSQAYAPREVKDFSTIFKLHPKLENLLERWAEQGDASRFRQSAVAVCERRRLFITLNGFIGLGPDSVQEGDVVAVLSGGDVPFLLRPIADVEPSDEIGENSLPAESVAATGKRYLLVGECYVEGLMQGEAIQAETARSELTGPVPQELVLRQIIAHGNQHEKVYPGSRRVVLEQAKKTKKRLDEGGAFTTNMLKQHARVIPEIAIFNIW